MGGESNRGDRFLEHLEPLQGALEAYCRRHLNDSAVVEDVLQSAVANAYRDFHLYVEGTNFRAWIFRYVHFEILAWNRRQQPVSSTDAVDAAVAPEWDSIFEDQLCDQLREAPEIVFEHCHDELARAVQVLPPRERSVLLLRAIGDFKYREIAEILEIPVGSVMGYLGRARAALRVRLAEFSKRSGFLRSRGE